MFCCCWTRKLIYKEAIANAILEDAGVEIHLKWKVVYLGKKAGISEKTRQGV